MIVKEIFDTIFYPKIKEFVKKESKYTPEVTKVMPEESKVFPIVTVKLLPIENQFNNLSYGEMTYTFGIDINVYAINKGKTSKRSICDEITEKVVEFFRTNYHVTIKIEYDLINIDEIVHRNNIRISGKLDTKYGLDKLVIYPR